MPYYTRAVSITARDSEHPGLGQDVRWSSMLRYKVPRILQTRNTLAMNWLALRLAFVFGKYAWSDIPNSSGKPVGLKGRMVDQ